MKTKQDLLNKIEAGVLQTAPWQKPLVLLIEDGGVYNDVFDTIREKYKTYCVVSEPKYNTFATVNDKFECLLDGDVVDAHKSDVDVYFYLEGHPLYDEVNLRYCACLAKYENKPVISLICDVAENVPDWVYGDFEVLIIK